MNQEGRFSVYCMVGANMLHWSHRVSLDHKDNVPFSKEISIISFDTSEAGNEHALL